MDISNLKWNATTIKKRITESDKWAARAIYSVSNHFHEITNLDPTLGESDEQFFAQLQEFFHVNGFFTDRQIALARRKMRDEYISLLVEKANEVV